MAHSPMQREARRKTDRVGPGDKLADVLEWVRAGEASVCFCVGMTQTLLSDHHTR